MRHRKNDGKPIPNSSESNIQHQPDLCQMLGSGHAKVLTFDELFNGLLLTDGSQPSFAKPLKALDR
jgi:hypothetical protein